MYARRRLSVAVTTLVDPPRRRSLLALVLAASLVAGACSGGGRDDEGSATEDEGPNPAALPTLAGGVDLAPVDPARLLVGEGLAYGTPLPSEQAAADVYLEDPQVAAVVARRLYSQRDGRLLGSVRVLALDGHEIYDEAVLDAFVHASVAALGDGVAGEVEVAGRPVIRSRGPGGTAVGYLEGDQLMLLVGANDRDVSVVIDRQLRALAAGATGATEPRTPLIGIPVDAAFVEVPTVTFEPIPPPEDELPPEPPVLPGSTGLQGRYGVVAGERRTTVWAFTLDPGAYPSAEVLDPALAALASSRAAGAPSEATEVLDRLVHVADGPDGEPSARAFRHRGLVLLVEGMVPAQLDAVVSAWITALGG
jgi:hypothetical protein